MRLVRVLAALATLPLAPLPATAGSAAPPSPATYLALGDSVSAGVGAPAGLGYVPVLAGELAAARASGQGQALGCGLELDNRSVGGATTVSLISGQLPGAVDLLEERNQDSTPVDDVRLITITIGGNDVFTPVIAACAGGFTATCQATVAAQFAQVATHYATILGELREAAGPDTTIAVMTYYNPLLNSGCRFTSLSQLGTLVLEGGGPLAHGLNDVIRQQAAAFGAVVVETGGIVAPSEVQPDCLHSNTAGHADIAQAFLDAVHTSVVGGPGGR